MQSCDSDEGTPAPSPPRSARRGRASFTGQDYNEGSEDEIPSESDGEAEEQVLLPAGATFRSEIFDYVALHTAYWYGTKQLKAWDGPDVSPHSACDD